jgi:hypothetical protein
MSQKAIADVITIAETLLGELAAMCAEVAPAFPYLIGLGFAEVVELIEALPPDTPQMEFYRNWARSSRQLWEEDEAQAASYQLTHMQRKLARLRVEWA